MRLPISGSSSVTAPLRSRSGIGCLQRGAQTEPRPGGSGFWRTSLGIAALLSIGALPSVGANWSYHVTGEDGAAWAAVLGSLGLMEGPANRASLLVAGPGTTEARVAPGGILILEGESPLASSYGFRATPNRVVVRGVEDLRAPQLAIVWEESADVPVFEMPKQGRACDSGSMRCAFRRWLR